MKRLIEILMLAGVIALSVFIMKDSATARQRLKDLAIHLKQYSEAKLGPHFAAGTPEKQPAASAPEPVASAAPTAAPEPEPRSAPQAASRPSSPEPTPEVETAEKILAQLSREKSEWPQTVVCREAIDFPALLNGAVVGSIRIPPGTPLKLLGVQMDQITVGYLAAKQVVPASKSNLVAQVSAKRHGAQPVQ